MKKNIPSQAVLNAQTKLMQQQTTQGLTLDEIMMCYFGLPCIRQSESAHQRFKRGSILVYKDRVIIICNSEDTSLEPCPRVRRTKYITPQRKYGVYPGSHFYTSTMSVYVLNDSCRVRALREQARLECVRPLRLGINSGGLFGSLRTPRCPQEAGLWGRLDAARFMRMRGLCAEGSD